MSALLKTKSKVQSERKERITYGAFDFEKKIGGPVEEVKQNADGQNDASSLINIEGKSHKIKPKVISKEVEMKKD